MHRLAALPAATVPAVLAVAGCATTDPVRDTAVRDARIAELAAALAADDSATRVLAGWCERHGIARPASIRAVLLPDTGTPPPPAVAALLGPGSIRHRHVSLRCGAAELSVAHNWYRADRLTPAMNARLEGSDAPFGQVAGPLRFRRERLNADLPELPCPAATLLVQRALLRLPDGAPLGLVIECYQPAILGGTPA